MLQPRKLSTGNRYFWQLSVNTPLWHGGPHRALRALEDLTWEIGTETPRATAMQDKLEEFMKYITANIAAILNYADRYRHGEPIATGFVESAVNQVVSKRLVKKQQMRWTMAGAHRLLQVRTRVLNQQLRHDFERWPRSCGPVPIPFARLRSTRIGPLSRILAVGDALDAQIERDIAAHPKYIDEDRVRESTSVGCASVDSAWLRFSSSPKSRKAARDLAELKSPLAKGLEQARHVNVLAGRATFTNRTSRLYA